jgi:glycosyltransferase involved in cell wall biosynthesis
MSELSVSIVVCTLDRHAQLARCLNSLMTLNHSKVEILVVDNGSRTISIPEMEYRCRTRFFYQPIAGLSYGRNLGAHFATGDIIAFIDDDAFARFDWLEKGLLHFENPDVACVTGRIMPVGLDGTPLEKSNRTFPDSEERLVFTRNNFSPLKASAGTGSNFLVRRNILDQFGFSELLGLGVPAGGAEEELLFFQVIKCGWTIIFEPEAIIYHEYPLEETSSRERKLRNSISRIAFLTLLVFKGGYGRAPLLSHAVKRMSGSPTPHQMGSGNFHWRSLILGPIALLHSAILAWKNHPNALKKSKLLKEFPGKE